MEVAIRENVRRAPLARVPMWLFLVEDGDEELVASWERDQEIYLSIVEVEAGTTATLVVNEASDPVVTADDVRAMGYDQLHDHWHIFIRGKHGNITPGRHWMAFSMSRQEDGERKEAVGIAAFSPSFAKMVGPSLLYEGSQPTNDLFVVETDTGVAVGIYQPGRRSNIVMLLVNDDDPTAVEAVVPLVTDGATANGSSATYDPHREYPWSILTPSTLHPCCSSPITRVAVPPGWDESGLVTTAVLNENQDGKTYGFAMPMEAVLPSGYRVLVVRRRLVDDDDAEYAADCPEGCETDLGGGGLDDSGDILLYVLDETGRPVADPVLIAQEGNRPHVISYGSKVMVAYDSLDQAYVWIGEVSVTETSFGASHAKVDRGSVAGVPISLHAFEDTIDAGTGSSATQSVIRVTRHLEEAGVVDRYGSVVPWRNDEASVLHLYRPQGAVKR